MAERISVGKALKNAGIETGEVLASVYEDEASVPACCSEGCVVEADGECPHGFPSVILAMGLI